MYLVSRPSYSSGTDTALTADVPPRLPPRLPLRICYSLLLAVHPLLQFGSNLSRCWTDVQARECGVLLCKGQRH